MAEMDNGKKNVRRQAIEGLAYRMWELAGRPEGDGLQFWYKAEHEYDANEKQSGESKALDSGEDKSGLRKWVCFRKRIWGFLESQPVRWAVMGFVLLSFVLVLILVVPAWPLGDESVVLTVLKLTGIAYAAGSGTLALFVDFKDKTTGRVTRWAGVALVGIIVSGSVAAGAEIISVYKGKHEAEENLRRRQEDIDRQNKQVLGLLSEISRGLHPFDTASFFLFAEVPCDDPRLTNYKHKLEKGIHDYTSTRVTNSPLFPKSGLSVIVSSNEGPEVIEISPKAVIYPSPDTLEHAVLAVRRAEVSIYKRPINPKKHRPFSQGFDSMPDIIIPLYDENTFSLQFDLRDKSVKSVGRFSAKRESWTSTGRIVSINDLAGAQMFFCIGPLGSESKGIYSNSDYLDLRKNVRLGPVNFGIGQRYAWFNQRDLKQYFTPEGLPFWVVQFPDPLEPIFETKPDR